MGGFSCDVNINWCRECPADLKEGVASLIFAAPRCSEIPELSALTNVFEKKYGKDFVSAATDLRPNCGVNRLVTTFSPFTYLSVLVTAELVGEENETLIIRVWKPFTSRWVLKILRESSKGKVQRDNIY